MIKHPDDPYHFESRFKGSVILSFRQREAMKTLFIIFAATLLTLGLYPLDAHAAIRKCNKELEADYRKFKK